MGGDSLQREEERPVQGSIGKAADIFQQGERLPVRLDEIRQADAHRQGGHASVAGVVEVCSISIVHLVVSSFGVAMNRDSSLLFQVMCVFSVVKTSIGRTVA